MKGNIIGINGDYAETSLQGNAALCAYQKQYHSVDLDLLGLEFDLVSYDEAYQEADFY